MNLLAELKLRSYRGEWVLDESGIVKYIEHMGDEVIEAELEGCTKDNYQECVIEDLTSRLGEELKLPRSVVGAIKAKLKFLGFPIFISLREEPNLSIVEFRGKTESFRLLIRYQIG